MRCFTLSVLLILLGCSESTEPVDASADMAADAAAGDAGADAGADADLPDATTGEPDARPTYPSEVGGERPAPVSVPSSYDPATPTPLLIVLHGYGASGAAQDLYFNTRAEARRRGWLLVLPDGTLDRMSPPRRFWNASSACCNFFDSPVDDVAYVRSLITEMKAEFNVDAGRVYLLGHSNGGFMSYRMACDAADEITAIASLAGAAEADTSTCMPSQPVSVLQIHGTTDSTISYRGATVAGRTYPSAMESVAGYAARAGCGDPEDAGTMDFASDVFGMETEIQAWTMCDEGLSAELWSIVGGSHIPGLAEGATGAILDWLGEHSR